LRREAVAVMRAKQNDPKNKISEMKARNSLRDMITEKEYRRYLSNGYILVKRISTVLPAPVRPVKLWYQVFNDQRRIQVYKNNKLVEKICIHTDDSCPPTDHVLNIKMLIETDIHSLYKNANVTTVKTGETSFTSTIKRDFKRMVSRPVPAITVYNETQSYPILYCV
jgi:hypothetical protein